MNYKINVSLHTFPPLHNNLPSPSIGYIKGYIKKKSDRIIVKNYYWNQIINENNIYNTNIFNSDVNQSFESELFMLINHFIYLKNSFSIDLIRDKLDFVKKSGAIYLSYPSEKKFNEIVDLLENFYIDKIVSFNICKDVIVGCSIMLNQLFSAMAFISIIKKRFPSIITVIGGCNDEVAEKLLNIFPQIDAAVFGYGEETFLEFCVKYNELNNKDKIDGLIYRSENGLIKGDKRKNISNIEFYADYTDFNWDIIKKDILSVPILHSTSCYWKKCGFCDYSNLDKHNYIRNNNLIIKDIKEQLTLIKDAKNKRIMINLLANEITNNKLDLFLDLLNKFKLLIQEFPYLYFLFEMSPKNFNNSVVDSLKDLKVYINFGIEQFSNIIKKMNKPHNLIDSFWVIKASEKYNFHIQGLNVLYGFPEETFTDLYFTHKNLFKLRFLLSSMANIKKNISSIRFFNTYITYRSIIGQKFNFNNELIINVLENDLFSVLLFQISSRNSDIIELTKHLRFFHYPDFSGTKKYSFLGSRFYQDMLKCNVLGYITNDNYLKIEMFDSSDYQEVLFDNYSHLLILKNTNKPIPKAELIKILNKNEKEVEENIKQLDDFDILFISEDDMVINTLPDSIQNLVDKIFNDH